MATDFKTVFEDCVNCLLGMNQKTTARIKNSLLSDRELILPLNDSTEVYSPMLGKKPALSLNSGLVTQ